MMWKEQGHSSVSTYQGGHPGVRIWNSSTLFDKWSCPKPLRCPRTTGIAEWVITWRGTACFHGGGTWPWDMHSDWSVTIVKYMSLIKSVGITAKTYWFQAQPWHFIVSGPQVNSPVFSPLCISHISNYYSTMGLLSGLHDEKNMC